MSNTTGKKLEKLFIDDEKISEDLLYDLLEPYIRFTKKTNEIIPTSEFANLRNEQKILVILLAIKALFVLGRRKTDKVQPKDLEKLTLIKGNTIRPILKKLYDTRIILKDPKEGYFVPAFSVQRIKEYLEPASTKEQ